MLAAGLLVASTMASALPFSLTASTGSVSPGGAFSATLSYDSASVPLEFGLDLTIAVTLTGGAGVSLADIVALDGGILSVTPGTALPAALPPALTVSTLVFGPVGGAGSAVDLLRFDFTAGAGGPGDVAVSVAGVGYDEFFGEIPFDESARVQVTAPPTRVPEGNTLASLLLGLGVLAAVRRRRHVTGSTTEG